MMRREIIVVLAQVGIAGTLLMGMLPERVHAQRLAEAVSGMTYKNPSTDRAAFRVSSGDLCEDWHVKNALIGAAAGALGGFFAGALAAPITIFSHTSGERFLVYSTVAGAILGGVLGASVPQPQECQP